jgi:uncharacterized protein (DUF3820 family)
MFTSIKNIFTPIKEVFKPIKEALRPIREFLTPLKDAFASIKKRVLQIANGIALVAVIIINYLAATGGFNGVTVADISDRYHNLFTPADYAFSIWSLIYFALFGFVIYQGRSLFKKSVDDSIVLSIGWWFILSCIANCLWIISWIYGYTGISVLIMVFLLFSLIQIILKTNMEMELISIKKIALTWWPFCLYAGWITVALIADIAAWLTKIGWFGFGLSEIGWAIIMIVIAAGINVAMIWTRNMREFALVGIWALCAIAVANWGSIQGVASAAVILSGVIFVNITVHGYINRNRSFLEIKKINDLSTDFLQSYY